MGLGLMGKLGRAWVGAWHGVWMHGCMKYYINKTHRLQRALNTMMFKSSRPNGDLTNRTRSYYELLEHKFKISSPRGFDPPIARDNYI